MADAAAARLVLASSSPRRSDLLRSLGLDFDIAVADIDESLHDDEHPTAYVERLAREKVARVVERLADGALHQSVVIGADTCVVRDDDVLGKPVDDDDTRAMLRSLSGRSHLVHTGVAVAFEDRVATTVDTTTVEFNKLDDATIEWYIATGEAHDKAGGYAMQGGGGLFVARIVGSPSNVVGLPLHVLATLAASIGTNLARFRV